MAEILSAIAAGNPDGRALADETGETTWRQLDERVNRLIHVLRAAGLEPEDRVAMVSGNRREAFEVYAACMHAGFTAVPVNWGLSPEDIAYVVDHSDARVLIVDDHHVDRIATAGAGRELRLVMGDGGGDGFTAYEAVLSGADAGEPEDQRSGKLMYYTSGTTGRPKGVNSAVFQEGVPLAGILEAAHAVCAGMGLPVGGRTLLVGPVYHSGQFAFSMFPLLCGGQLIIRRGPDPEVILDTIDRERITNLLLLPVDLQRLLRLPQERRQAFDGSSLVQVLHGGAPCPSDVKQRMLDWWGDRLTEYYGASEGGVFATVRPDDWRSRPGTVGKPLPFIEARVVDDQGRETASGEVGDLYFRHRRGAEFSYHKDEAKTVEAHLEPGLFTVGDVGYMDDEGFLFISGRQKDVVHTRGRKVYPPEVEGVLAGHPAVEDVAVLGVPSDDSGEEVRAVVTVVPGHEASPALEKELLAFAADRLDDYKHPRAIDFVDEMPRTEAGKLQKEKLRDRLGSGQRTS